MLWFSIVLFGEANPLCHSCFEPYCGYCVHAKRTNVTKPGKYDVISARFYFVPCNFSDDFDDNKIIMMNIVFIMDFRIVSSQPLLHFFQPFVLDEDRATLWSRKTEFNLKIIIHRIKFFTFALLSLFAREFFPPVRGITVAERVYSNNEINKEL